MENSNIVKDKIMETKQQMELRLNDEIEMSTKMKDDLKTMEKYSEE